MDRFSRRRHLPASAETGEVAGREEAEVPAGLESPAELAELAEQAGLLLDARLRSARRAR